ncbi:AAA family ATPase [Gordonia sp. FQ]|uniref:AAA family ATPase n=1 Tax=Gordonia sp. FQ TaxID=3446634 RepID=UPI003F87AF75
MLIWINGPFGVGKTQAAFELRRRLPGSIVCDPELVGYGLNRMLPAELRGDFQDFPAWRQGVYEALDRVLTHRRGVVIVPMTIIEPGRLAEIVGRLRGAGHDVRHFSLLAEPETVRARLRSRRLPFRGPDRFALDRLDLCLERLSGPGFAEQIRTDGLTVPRVAERIAERAGLLLTSNDDAPLRGRVRRMLVSIRHIRIG